MRHWQTLLTAAITFVILAVLTGPLWADLESAPFNFNPTTGLINIPIAQVLPPGQVRLAVHRADIGGLNDDDGLLAFSPTENAEISVLGLSDHAVSLGAQFMLTRTPTYSVAAGVQNLNHREPGGTFIAHAANTDVAAYVVASKELVPARPGAARVHLGVGTGRFAGLFGGVDAAVTDRLQLMGEWDGREVNAGARWTVARGAYDRSELRLIGAYLDLKEPSAGAEVVFRF